MMKYDFSGKTVAITGGGSGIGKLSCQRFAEAGAQVAVIDINGVTAQQTADEITKAGFTATAFQTDITDEQAVEATFKAINDCFGSVDILFNQAGTSPVGTLETTSYDDLKKVFAIDTFSIFLTCKYVLPYMKQQGGGAIINTIGTYALRYVQNKIGYCSAKAAALSITKSVAVDYARDNIRCNAICPGYVDTPLNKDVPADKRDRFLDRTQPMHYLITAEDIAQTALFLASEASHAITGQAIVVDGGTEATLIYTSPNL
jgi:Dehydrogenases with different specificities (related to short-chain alcohol dehydrogenases)